MAKSFLLLVCLLFVPPCVVAQEAPGQTPVEARGYAPDAGTIAESEKPFEQKRKFGWVMSPGDVWSIPEFRFDAGRDFRIEAGACDVAVGHADGVPIVAVVLPREPATMTCERLGMSERVGSIHLRFDPAAWQSLLGDALREPGDRDVLPAALRIAAHKRRSAWHSGGAAVIPSPGAMVLDAEPADPEGRRWYFSRDDAGSAWRHWPELERAVLPRGEAVDEEEALRVFDAAWAEFDRQYAGFVNLPNVDWNAVRERLRPKAAKARYQVDLGLVVSAMLWPLEDLHAWVKVDDEFLPAYNRVRLLNAPRSPDTTHFGKFTKNGQMVAWGLTQDGIGYIVIGSLSGATTKQDFDDAMEALKESKALVVDLRYNGGGDELLGQAIAGRFTDEPLLYSRNVYRDGPAHTDLTKQFGRTFPPRGPWRYDKPVIALQGRVTLSSAESLAAMLKACAGVTTMGEPTGGSSGNPRVLQPERWIRINVPRWLDMDADGTPVERRGIAPEMLVEFKPGDFADGKDPLLERALEELRREIKENVAAPEEGPKEGISP